MTAPSAVSRAEFVAMMAMLVSTTAFSIDSMLPALPEIAAELTPDAVNRAQLIITSFVFGMGLGTFVTGPLSDAFGRKPVLVAGAALYALGTVLAWAANSLELLLAARVVQGFGIAGPRVVAIALIRDLYSGRAMAKLVSFVMTIFTLVPALAPSLGAVVIALWGWRSIFLALLVFAAISVAWVMLRQAETLPPAARRRTSPAVLLDGVRQVFGNRQVVLSTAVQSLAFGMLFSVLSTTQPIFDETFGRGDTFPLWFGAIALFSGTSSILNAMLVERLGMRLIATAALTAQLCLSLLVTAIVWSGILSGDMLFALYVFWTGSIFYQAGLTIGNLNALAMEPLGHIAGLGASLIGAVSTVIAVVLAVPIGLAYDGTPLPLSLGAVVLSATAVLLMRNLSRSVADSAAA